MKPLAAIALAVTVIAGGGAGAMLALKVRSGDRESPAPSGAQDQHRATALLPKRPGYYLCELRRSGLDIDAMTPTLVSPARTEEVPPHCPERLAVVTGNDTHAGTIQPILDAIGAMEFGKAGPGGVAAGVARSLQTQWASLKTLAGGPVSSPPLRVLYKHYPREGLPGRCVTIHATVYNVPDTYFDQVWFRQNMRQRDEQGMEVRGIIYEVRKTYQMEGGKPLLIEAVLEVHTHVRVGIRRQDLRQALGSDRAHPLAMDNESTAHFMAYGGGERHGLVWIDTGMGMGKRAGWSAAYRIRTSSNDEPPKCETEALTEEMAARLREIVERA